MNGPAPDVVTGTLTRPFPRNPQPFVPSATAPPLLPPSPQATVGDAAGSGNASVASAASSGNVQRASRASVDESDAWRQKQVEIQQLQQANRTLLRRVSTSSVGTPNRGGLSNSLPNLGADARSPGMPSEAARSPGQAPLLPPDAEEVASHSSSAGPPSAASAGRRYSATPADLLRHSLGSSSSTAALAAYLPTSSQGLAPALPVALPSDRSSQCGRVPETSDDTRAIAAIPRLETSFSGAASTRLQRTSDPERRRMAEELAALRKEVIELRRQASERERELRVQKAAAQRGDEASAKLEEAEAKIGDLQAEIQKQKTAKELVDQLESGNASAVHKTVRNYIENDLESMRSERKNAEALLIAQAKKWEEQVVRLKVERDGLEADLARTEAEMARFKDENAAASATLHGEEMEELRERHAAELQHQAAAAQAALQELDRRVQSTAEAHRTSEARMAAAAAAASLAHQELQAECLAAQQQRADLMAMDQRLIDQEALAAEERQELHEAFEQKESAVAEEKRKLKKDAAKRTAELQARASEFREEAEEAAAKAKDAERNMHTKLASARQDRQRAETKFKSQIQTLQSEVAMQAGREAFNAEAEQMAQRFTAAVEETEKWQAECKSIESELSSIRSKNAQVVRQLRQENEACQRQVRSSSDKANHEFQVELLEERKRSHAELWERIQSVEERHVAQVSQLRETQARELQVMSESSQMLQTDLESRLKAQSLQLQLEDTAAKTNTEEIATLQRCREELLAELQATRADMQGVVQQHEALVVALRKEHSVADNQFQQMLRQAEEKQRRIGRLQHEGVWDEAVDWPPTPEVAPSISTEATAVSRPHQQIPLTPSSTRSRYGFGGAASIGSGDPHLIAQTADVQGADSVEHVMRALARERDFRKAARIGEELKQLLSCATWESGKGEEMLRISVAEEEVGVDDLSERAPTKWKRLARQLLVELLNLHEQAMQNLADEELRLAAARDREATLRNQVARIDSRTAATRAEALEREKRHAEAAAAECAQLEEQQGAAIARMQAQLGQRLADAEERTAGLLAERAQFQHEALEDAKRVAEVDVAVEHERGLQNLANLERSAAQDFLRLECEVADGREEVRAELSELQRTLNRELSSTREEKGTLTRNELNMEAKCERLVQEHHDIAAELDAAQLQVVEVQENLEARERTLRDEMKASTELYEEQQNLLAREITAFQDEKLILEARIQSLERGSLATSEELSEARVRVEEVHVKEPGRRNEEMHRLRTRTREAEVVEMRATEAMAELDEQHRVLLAEHEATERGLKEQLKAAREDKVKEKMQSDRLAKKLRARIQEFEEAETSAVRQRDLEVKTFRRSSEAFAKQISEAKKMNSEKQMELYEKTSRQQGASEALEEMRRDLMMTEAQHQDEEGRWRHLEEQHLEAEREAQALLSTQRQREAELQEQLNAALANQEQHLVSHRNQVAKLYEETEALQQHKEHLREEAGRLRAQAHHHRMETKQLLQAFESEISKLVPVMGEDTHELQQALTIGSNDRSMDQVEGAVAAAFQAIAARLADLARDREDLNAKYVAVSLDLEVANRARGRRPTKTLAALSPPRGSDVAQEGARSSLSPTRASLSGAHGQDAGQNERATQAKKIALLQKELVKLREENQELRLEQTDLREHRVQRVVDTDDACCQTEIPKGKPSVEASSGSVPKPLAVAGQVQMDYRQKIKELQKAKDKKESEVVELRHELVQKCQPLKEEIEKLQNALWEQKQQREAEEESDKRKVATLERRVRILEGKLRDRVETCRALAAEKETVEEQLNGAVRQLEALLAEEHKDFDLQRDLAGLSKQFELLHGKHRTQLARAAEQNKQLQGERDKRQQLERQLRDARAQMDEELVEAAQKHDEQLSAMQETAQSLRRRGTTKDRELQESQSEQAALTVEVSKLRTTTHQQILSAQELQDEVKRLQAELQHQYVLLSEARETTPSMRQKDVELRMSRLAVESAESAAQRAQSEAETHRQQAQRLQVELRAQAAELTSVKEVASKQRPRDGAAALRITPADASADDDDDRPVRVRLGNGNFDAWSPPTGMRGMGGNTGSTSGPQGRSDGGAADGFDDTDAGIVSALEEIKDTLRSRERQLQEMKERSAPVLPAIAAPASTSGALANISAASGGGGGGSASSQAPASAADDRGAATGFEGVAAQQPPTTAAPAIVEESVSRGDRPSLQEIERDFGAFARSIGFRGDPTALWEEARAAALASQGLAPPSAPPQPPPSRAAPIAADVQLKVTSPPAGGAGDLGPAGGYPQSPPGTPAIASSAPVAVAEPVESSSYPMSPGRSGGYPMSPGRSDSGWLSVIEEWGGASQQTLSREDGAESSSSAAKAGQAGADGGSGAADGRRIEGYPLAAREAFRHAEALCEQQLFAEAVPIFRRVLQILDEHSNSASANGEAPVPPAAFAEVWAHLGVAMQSLDRVPEAIDCYKRAVLLDSSLHVCFANLATLHAYLHEHDRAVVYIEKALALDPANATYTQIRRSLPAPAGAASSVADGAADPRHAPAAPSSSPPPGGDDTQAAATASAAAASSAVASTAGIAAPP